MGVTLLSTTVEGATRVDPRIQLVESGLLPVAAVKIGVPANIEERMRVYGVPGLSIAVVEDGKIAWAKGYGISDAASGRLVTTQTLFQAASISKPISAMGVLVLVQRNLVSLDDNVNDKLKNWAIPETDLTRANPITVRMLLNHTAGAIHEASGGHAPFTTGDRLPTLVQVLKGESPARSGPVRIASLPGQRFEYSGAGYEILQQLITDVAGRSFEEFMQSEILGPIGMSSSTFSQPLPESLLAHAATGHYAGGAPLPGRFRMGPELAVAGLWTTPIDIAKFVINVQQSQAGSIENPLNAGMVHAMLEPGLASRGLGPAISGSGQSMRWGHDGFNEGFESSFVAYVHGGRGAVVMANSGFAFMLIKEVLDSISRVYAWPEYGATTQQPPSAAIRQQLVVPVSPAALAGTTGKYELGDQLTIKIFSQDGRLFLDWPNNGIAEVFATPDGRYFCPQLTFSDIGSPWLQFIPGDGGITASILGSDAGSAEFQRIQ